MKKSSAGFTLIELMIVIAIIAILVTIVVMAINPVKILNDTNDTKRKTEINQIKTALQVYYNDNTDYPPSNSLKCRLEGTSTSPCSSAGTVYMKQVPSQTFYGYYYDSVNQSYILGAQLYGSSDTISFDKCAVSGTSPSLTPTSGSTAFTLARSATSAGGYIACPD